MPDGSSYLKLYYTSTCMHPHTHTHIHAHTYTHTCTHAHTHTYTHSHIHAYTYTHTCTHVIYVQLTIQGEMGESGMTEDHVPVCRVGRCCVHLED